VDSGAPASRPVRQGDGEASWPVRLGAVPPLAEHFSARPETAPDLTAALVPGAATVLVPGQALAEGPDGWPGSCGTTQLAVSFAKSLWRSGGVDLLVWVAATSRASVLSSYAAAALATVGADPAGNAAAAAAGFARWLATTSRPWLVVLDDLSDAADLAGLMPQGPAGRVLITTRASSAVPAEHRVCALPVGVFSPAETLSYLRSRLAVDPGQQAGAEDLARALGGEPLALAQASAVIEGSARSCRDYLDRFARRRQQLAEVAGRRPAAAAVTWTLSADLADQLSPGAARPLLALAAVLDGHAIPAAVFAARAVSEYLAEDGSRQPANPERATEALAAAARAGLLTAGPPSLAAAVRMSPVVQSAVLAATPDEIRPRAVLAAAGALLEVWPEDERSAWLAGVLRSCTASLQRAGGDLLWTGGCHPLLLRAGRSLDEARLTGPALTYWKDLAAAGARVLGRGHPDTLTAGDRLAGAYLAAGQAAEAASSYESVLAERVRVLGPDHPTAITARRELGHALMAANQFAGAITVLSRVVADYERVRGAGHADTLDAQDELATAYLGAGQYPDAVLLLRKTLTTREGVQGPENLDVMATRHKLADACLADGRLKEALAEYKRTLTGRERVLGAGHLDTVAARVSLGTAYLAAGRMASAIKLYEQARAGYVKALGADHRESLACSAKLAEAYHAVGRVSDARSLLRDTLPRCERALPPGDPLAEAVRERLARMAAG
jgi:tetratricopeptide (TPR) repeat protein